MATQYSIYEDHGKKYQADRCKPVLDAIKQGNIELNALARQGYPGQKLLASELPQLLAIGCWDSVGSQNWGLDWHRNEGLELTFMETGSTPFAVTRNNYTLKTGDLTITRPWQPHRVGNPNIGSGRLHWIILDVGIRKPHQKWQWPQWLVLSPADIKRLTTLLRHNEKHVWHATSEMNHCFQQIARTIKEKDSSRRTSHLAVLINQLFITLLDTLEQKNISLKPELTSTRRTVEMFLEDLHSSIDNLSHQWTSESMADQCDIGVTCFCNLCKQITNMTPVQFLNYHRIQAAADMIKKHSNKSITFIAFKCGFTSSQYFATVFKKFKKCSPSDYKKI